MPLSAQQTAAIKEVLQTILAQTITRGKRLVQVAGMFMDLVDRQEWPQYYEASPLRFLSLIVFKKYFQKVIPEPRCLKNIQTSLDKGRYKEPLDVYRDISLVFWNALFYNEPDSQIADDANSLKVWSFVTLFQINALTARRVF